MVGIIQIGIAAFMSSLLVQGYSIHDTGEGKMHKLEVRQDVWLERPNSNYNHYRYLIVGKLTDFPLKRSLVQFESLRSSCPLHKIRKATMYLMFAYAHIASWHKPKSKAPWYRHVINVHRVKKSWIESQATTTRRRHNAYWSGAYLKLGKDAEAQPQCSGVRIEPYHPRYSYIPFDVTGAVRSWAEGAPNYGLLLKLKNESRKIGRGIRFFSKQEPNKSRRPFLHVLCKN